MYTNNLDDAFSAFASGATEEWVKSDKYMDYPEYHDEEYTYIEGRTIGDITAQVSVQGEAYSQYISFMIDRYYDGIDLIGMSIWIHYELKDGSGSEDSPVNVMYNDSAIRFGWVIPEKATQQSGDIKIGVWVNGTAPNTKAYILKTEEKIYTIHPGLIPGSGITQPDQTWFQNFVVQMDNKVSTAQGYADDAQASRTEAAGSATAAAQSAAASAQALKDNKVYVESQKETFVGYNKRETDLKYANALVGSASGTGQVSVGDAWEAPVAGMEVAGMSEQVVTTGAQLFDIDSIITSDGIYVDGNSTKINACAWARDIGQACIASLKPATVYHIKGSIRMVQVVDSEDYIMASITKKLSLFRASSPTQSGVNVSLISCTYVMINGQEIEIDRTFTTPESVEGCGILIYTERYTKANSPDKCSQVEFKDIMISEVDSAWEPYTGGKPSPSPEYPQPLDVTVTGDNLLSIKNMNLTYNNLTLKVVDGIVQLVGTPSAVTVMYYAGGYEETEILFTLPAGKHFISDCRIISYDGQNRRIVTGAVDFAEPFNVTAILSENYSANVAINKTLYPMINQGDTAIPWQPYQSCTATITLTEPLRGIGDYRDRIMCKDGVWGIERRRDLAVYDGLTNRAVSFIASWDELYPGFVHCNLTKMADWLVGQKNFISDLFICTTEDNRNFSNTELACHTANNALQLFLSYDLAGIINDDDTATRLAKVNAWIQSHNFKVEYSTTTPTWEPLPTATQSALNALTTYTGTTHVTVTVGGPEPDVGLEYVMDTNAVIAELKKLIEGMQNAKS